MTCSQCECIPKDYREFPLIDREILWNNSHERTAIWICHHCRQDFAEYWWEVVSWGDGNDELLALYAPVSSKEVAKFRDGSCDLRELFRSRSHLVKEPDGQYWWASHGFFGPDLLSPG